MEGAHTEESSSGTTTTTDETVVAPAMPIVVFKLQVTVWEEAAIGELLLLLHGPWSMDKERGLSFVLVHGRFPVSEKPVSILACLGPRWWFWPLSTKFIDHGSLDDLLLLACVVHKVDGISGQLAVGGK